MKMPETAKSMYSNLVFFPIAKCWCWFVLFCFFKGTKKGTLSAPNVYPRYSIKKVMQCTTSSSIIYPSICSFSLHRAFELPSGIPRPSYRNVS